MHFLTCPSQLDCWPNTRASIEQFRREARRGQVIEMKDATHFIFRGTTADQVVRQTRDFLLN